MVHSTKTTITSETVEWCSMKSVCGVEKLFKTGNQADTWLRLHNKKCDTCKDNKNKLKCVYTPTQIIDLENKSNKIV
jgi:hypothetical protein